MERILPLRKTVDALLLYIQDQEERRCAYVHLYGVAQACALLAHKRQEDAELAVAAGMLHDLYAYLYTPEDHAIKSAEMAQKLLDELNLFSPYETAAICTAIAHHSDKAVLHDPLSELLKDADVLQHALYDPTAAVKPFEHERYTHLCCELELKHTKNKQ